MGCKRAATNASRLRLWRVSIEDGPAQAVHGAWGSSVQLVPEDPTACSRADDGLEASQHTRMLIVCTAESGWLEAPIARMASRPASFVASSRPQSNRDHLFRKVPRIVTNPDHCHSTGRLPSVSCSDAPDPAQAQTVAGRRFVSPRRSLPQARRRIRLPVRPPAMQINDGQPEQRSPCLHQHQPTLRPRENAQQPGHWSVGRSLGLRCSARLQRMADHMGSISWQ